MSDRTSITPEQKKRRFRELLKDDRLTIAGRFAEEREQPFLPFNEFKTRVSQDNPRRRAGVKQAAAAK